MVVVTVTSNYTTHAIQDIYIYICQMDLFTEDIHLTFYLKKQ